MVHDIATWAEGSVLVGSCDVFLFFFESCFDCLGDLFVFIFFLGGGRDFLSNSKRLKVPDFRGSGLQPSSEVPFDSPEYYHQRGRSKDMTFKEIHRPADSGESADGSKNVLKRWLFSKVTGCCLVISVDCLGLS